MEGYFSEVEETWENYQLVIDEYRDLGDRVLVLGRIEGRGRCSGLPIDTPWGCVFEFRGGRIPMRAPFSTTPRRSKLWGWRSRPHIARRRRSRSALPAPADVSRQFAQFADDDFPVGVHACAFASRLGRQPRDIEVATYVAASYRERDRLVKTALKKFDDLVKELQTREYVFPGMEDHTGREPLPPARS